MVSRAPQKRRMGGSSSTSAIRSKMFRVWPRQPMTSRTVREKARALPGWRRYEASKAISAWASLVVACAMAKPAIGPIQRWPKASIRKGTEAILSQG